MREWSIVMAEIRILYRGIVRNLNLLRGLYIALWRLNLLNRWYMVRGGIVGSGGGCRI